jgi:hypothetical protein
MRPQSYLTLRPLTPDMPVDDSSNPSTRFNFLPWDLRIRNATTPAPDVYRHHSQTPQSSLYVIRLFSEDVGMEMDYGLHCR